jgi:hypothetical protein
LEISFQKRKESIFLEKAVLGRKIVEKGAIRCSARKREFKRTVEKNRTFSQAF